MGVKHRTIRDALRYVSEHPEPSTDPIDMPIWEHVCRGLFEMANNPDTKIRGGMARATKAQGMILDRMVGKRRAGTKPVSGGRTQVAFLDLTEGLIEDAGRREL